MAFEALLIMAGAAAAKVPPKCKDTLSPAVALSAGRGVEPSKSNEAAQASRPVVVEDEKPKARVGSESRDHDVLDPTARVTAHLAPPMSSVATSAAEPATQRSRVSLEELIPQVVRRIAWGGDRTKGSVHLELATGEKVTVHAEGRRVRVEVEGSSVLERRIGSRLRAAGIEVEVEGVG